MTIVAIIAIAGLGALPAVAQEDDAWERSVALGFSLTDGNSETLGLNVGANADRAWDENELSFGASYSYGEVDGEDGNETTKDNATADAQYNRLFSERNYGYVAASFLYDDIADIDYRIIAQRERQDLAVRRVPAGDRRL
jgi:hypothetical protein